MHVDLTLPKGVKRWPRDPSVLIDAGKKGAFVQVTTASFENAKLSAAPGSVAWDRTPERVRISLGPAFAPIDWPINNEALWSGNIKLSPAVVGWDLVPPRGGLPAGSIFRLTTPGSAEPVILAYEPNTNRLRLPEGFTWEMVAGSDLEIRSSHRRPLLFPSVDSPRLDARAAAERLDAQAAETQPDAKKSTARSYVLGNDVPPLILVINDPGRVSAESAETEDRIRQAQTDVVRNLVEGARRTHYDLLTFTRVSPGAGDWPPTGRAELLNAKGEIPFARVQDDAIAPVGLAATLHNIFRTPGAGDLADRLVVIVVTPYGPRTDDPSRNSHWLDVTLKQLPAEIKLGTVVVGPPHYIKDAELARRYVKPHRLDTADDVDIIAGARIQAEQVLQSAGVKPLSAAGVLPRTRVSRSLNAQELP